MKCWCWCWIYDPKQKHQALHTYLRPLEGYFYRLRTEDWDVLATATASSPDNTRLMCFNECVIVGLCFGYHSTEKAFWLDHKKGILVGSKQVGVWTWKTGSIHPPPSRSKLSPHDTCVSMSVSLQASSWSVFWLSLNRRGWLVGSQKRHFPSQIQRNIVKCYAGTNPSSAQQKQALPTRYEMCYCRPLGVCFGYHSTKKVFWLDQKRWSLDLGDRFNPSSAQRERALPTRQLHQSPTLISSSGDHSKTIWRFLGP